MSIETSDELNTVLIGAVTKTVDAVETATEFLAAQAPEVIDQLLMWHMVKSALLCMIGVLVLSTLVFCKRSWVGKGDKKDPTKGYDYQNRYATSTHDGDGDISGVGTIILMSAGLIGIVGSMIIGHNMDWLQILVAEKIWLMEYATDMVRKVR